MGHCSGRFVSGCCAVFVLLTVVGAEASAAADPSALPLGAQAAVAGALAKGDRAFAARTTADGTVELRNDAHDLTATITAEGVAIAHEDVHWRLALRRWGRGEELTDLSPGDLVAAGNRVDVRRRALGEWYVNGALGIEQGFTLDGSPSAPDGRPVVLELAASGDATLAVADDRTSLEVRGADGAVRMRYAGLTAFDADGRVLPVALHAEHYVLRITVDDRGARYPVVIDPLVQTAKLVPAKPRSFLEYGNSIAISGDTLVVGVPGEPIHQGSPPYIHGAIHVFEKSGPSWANITEVAVIRGVAGFGLLGYSVAFDGDTIVSGSPATSPELVGGKSGGAAAVYVRPPGGWTDMPPTAVLTASDKVEDDTKYWFANAVAIDGDTIVVGASEYGPSGYGAVYVYQKPIAGWVTASENGKLTASLPIFSEALGTSVAISGDVIVAGASDSPNGSALIYEKPIGGWVDATEEARISASDGQNGDGFGVAVALDGDTIAVGSPSRAEGIFDQAGSVYVFEKPLGGWASGTETARLLPSTLGIENAVIGATVAMSGGRIVAGAPGFARSAFGASGAVFVFDMPVGGWAPIAESALLTTSDTDYAFGYAVDVGADGTVAASTPAKGIPPYVHAGSAYVFEEIAGAVTCTSTPLGGCAAAGKGQLKLKWNTAKPDGTQLQWKFGAGPELHRADFGDPVNVTGYALCIYGDGNLTLANQLLGGFGRWSLSGTDAYAFANKDKVYAISGLRKAQLRGGVAGKSAIQVQGKGVDVGDMPEAAIPNGILDATTSVRVQLQQSGGSCYETTFLPAHVKTNSYEFLSPSSYDVRGTFQAGY